MPEISTLNKDIQVLILAYYFPPSNSTASDRTYYWLKFLQKSFANITVICKDWGSIENLPEKTAVSQISIDDKAFKKFGIKPGIKKIYKQFSPIIEPLWLLQGEEELMKAADQFITTHENVVLITSSSPYSLFKIGYLLKDRHPKLSWIADYRDEWSSRELVNFKIPVVSTLLIKWTEYLEKKWVSRATCFTTVSDVLAHRIAEVHSNKIPGYVIENGYDRLRERQSPSDHSQIHFAYTGNVYKVQNFEKNISEISKVARNYPQIRTIVSFVGGSFSAQRKRKMNQLAEHIDLRFIDHMLRKDLDAFNQDVDVFMMAAYGDIKGYQSSKIYYYISMKKPVFLCPSDDDVMQEILTDCGIKLNDLRAIYEAKVESKTFISNIASEEILHKYSREAGTEKLKKIINNITKSADKMHITQSK